MTPPCDGCGAVGVPLAAFPFPEGPGAAPICPQCARSEALAGAALDALEASAAPLLAAWADYWKAAGLRPLALAGLLTLYAEGLAGDLEAHPHT